MPVITLTTDFGPTGPFVGIMKGVILSRLPTAQVVDLTHDIHVHWPAEAGFWLAHAWRNFPAASVHVAVVDPGVGTDRKVLVAELDGQPTTPVENQVFQLIDVITPFHA